MIDYTGVSQWHTETAGIVTHMITVSQKEKFTVMMWRLRADKEDDHVEGYELSDKFVHVRN